MNGKIGCHIAGMQGNHDIKMLRMIGPHISFKKIKMFKSRFLCDFLTETDQIRPQFYSGN